MTTGVLFYNLGGPERPEDVKPFLRRLFSDPDILVGLPAPLRIALAWLISLVKGPSSARSYRKIGGGSPQLKWSRTQAALAERELGTAGERYVCTVGMRAWEPDLEKALKELRAAGAAELVLVPLFPQYSTTTTGSCLKEISRILRKMNWGVAIRRVLQWPDHPGYIRLLRETIDEAVERAREESGGDDPHVVFSAHSLPMKIIERGDPYPRYVDATIQAVTRDFPWKWSLAFQSRNGPVPWLEPYIEDELPRLASKGVKTVVLVPVSFVSDHIETLFELDMEYADLARHGGIENYVRSRSFNGDPKFGSVLAELARSAPHARLDELNQIP